VIDAAFTAEWREERRVYVANLVKPDLSGRDLRRASASGAFLVGVNLSEARLEGANLRGARLEGADLRGARLEGAFLSGARLEGADLWDARLEGAYLAEARLEGAFLSVARLEGANLFGARLEGANLHEARLEGAFLSGAAFQAAQWTGAAFGPSTAHSADFSAGKNLTQTQLEEVIGDEDTILPLDAVTVEQLYVWSCWEEVPSSFEQLWIEHYDLTPESFRETMLERAWLCAEGEAPRRVGRPAEDVASSSD
jgi:hypothetical protein